MGSDCIGHDQLVREDPADDDQHAQEEVIIQLSGSVVIAEDCDSGDHQGNGQGSAVPEVPQPSHRRPQDRFILVTNRTTDLAGLKNAGSNSEGRAAPTRWICEQIGPVLRDRGLLFTGIRELERASNVRIPR